MYAYGHGISKDDAEAVKWFRLAADQGNADAQAAIDASPPRALPANKDQAKGNADAQAKLAVNIFLQHMSTMEMEFMGQVVSLMNCGKPLGPDSRYKLQDYVRDRQRMSMIQMNAISRTAYRMNCGLIP